MICEVQHPARLIEVLTNLNHEGAVDLVTLEVLVQVGRHVIDPKGGHVVAHPRVFLGVVLPAVMVSVYAHWNSQAGDGV